MQKMNVLICDNIRLFEKLSSIGLSEDIEINHTNTLNSVEKVQAKYYPNVIISDFCFISKDLEIDIDNFEQECIFVHFSENNIDYDLVPDYCFSTFGSEDSNNKIKYLFKCLKKESFLRCSLYRKFTDLIKIDRMYKMSTIFGGIAHKVNNIATHVLGNDYLLKKMLNGDFFNSPDFERKTENIKGIVSSISEGVVEIKDVIGGLKRYVISDDMRPEVLNINRSVRNTLSLLNEFISKKVKVDIDLTPECFCNANLVLLEQVIISIVINSVNSLKNRQDGVITINTSKDEHIVEMSISDNGPGIKPDILDDIQASFCSPMVSSDGHYFGLAVARRIVRLFSGELYINSVYGNGTTIKMTFPACNQRDKNA